LGKNGVSSNLSGVDWGEFVKTGVNWGDWWGKLGAKWGKLRFRWKVDVDSETTWGLRIDRYVNLPRFQCTKKREKKIHRQKLIDSMLNQ
jgi:hypothetical protein